MNCVSKRVPFQAAETFGGDPTATTTTFELDQTGQGSGLDFYPNRLAYGRYGSQPHNQNDEDEDDDEDDDDEQTGRLSGERGDQKRLEEQRQRRPLGPDAAAGGQLNTFKCPNSDQNNNGQTKAVKPTQQRRNQKCDRPLRSHGDLGDVSTWRNSLESIQSRQSTPSAGADSSPSSAVQTPQTVGPLRGASGKTVLVATRYVSPPRVDERRLSNGSTWQTIPLHDQDDQCRRPEAAGAQSRLEMPLAAIRQARRLSSFVAKILTSRSSDDANAQPPARVVRAGGERSPSSGRVGAPGKWNEPELSEGSRDESWQPQGLPGRPEGQRRPSGGRHSLDSSWSQPSGRGERRQIGKDAKPPFMFAGILGSILGSCFFSVGMLCIKLLPDGEGLAEKTKIVCFRGSLIALLCALTIIYQNSTFKVKRDEIWINALRSIFGSGGVYGAYISLKYISMGDSTALVFSSPIWTSLLSHFILNEPLQWIQLLALPASLLGILFIAHPGLLVQVQQELQPLPAPEPLVEAASDLAGATTWSAPLNVSSSQLEQVAADFGAAGPSSNGLDMGERWKGIVIALGTSILVSLIYIVLKFRKSTPIQTATFWLGVTQALVSLCVMFFVGFGNMPASASEWALLTCNGVCSWLAQVLLQWALAFEDASVLSVIRTLDVAMTFALSALFLDEQILWTSVLGAAIIATVVVSIMLNKWLSKRLCASRKRAPSSELSNDCQLAAPVGLEDKPAIGLKPALSEPPIGFKSADGGRKLAAAAARDEPAA